MSFDDFKNEDGGGPVDGTHTAWLEHVVLRDTRNGKAIKCEWRTTDMAYYWESWHNTSGGGKAPTQELLDKLGIDFAQLSGWEALEDALALAEGPAYVVKVSRSTDGRFINTAVVERPDTVQTEMPVDTRDLPEPAPVPAGGAPAAGAAGDLFGDDDIPF